MDNHLIVGVGNIYANESLFRAGIRPTTPANRVSKARLARLIDEVRATLADAIAKGGSTLRDYVDSHGEPGYFQLDYFVYGQAGPAVQGLRCRNPADPPGRARNVLLPRVPALTCRQRSRPRTAVLDCPRRTAAPRSRQQRDRRKTHGPIARTRRALRRLRRLAKAPGAGHRRRCTSGSKRHDLADAQIDLKVQQLLARLHEDKLIVAFVAEFSRGKSELINAIFFADFGQRLLPTTAGRTTMCPTELLFDATRPPSIRLLPIETRLKDATVMEFRNFADEWVTFPLDLADAGRMSETLVEGLAGEARAGRARPRARPLRRRGRRHAAAARTRTARSRSRAGATRSSTSRIRCCSRASSSSTRRD